MQPFSWAPFKHLFGRVELAGFSFPVGNEGKLLCSNSPKDVRRNAGLTLQDPSRTRRIFKQSHRARWSWDLTRGGNYTQKGLALLDHYCLPACPIRPFRCPTGSRSDPRRLTLASSDHTTFSQSFYFRENFQYRLLVLGHPNSPGRPQPEFPQGSS